MRLVARGLEHRRDGPRALGLLLDLLHVRLGAALGVRSRRPRPWPCAARSRRSRWSGRGATACSSSTTARSGRPEARYIFPFSKWNWEALQLGARRARLVAARCSGRARRPCAYFITARSQCPRLFFLARVVKRLGPRAAAAGSSAASSRERSVPQNFIGESPSPIAEPLSWRDPDPRGSRSPGTPRNRRRSTRSRPCGE